MASEVQLQVSVNAWIVRLQMLLVWLLIIVLRRRIRVDVRLFEPRMRRGVLRVTPYLSISTQWRPI